MTEMIKFEDDVVVEYVFGMLEDKELPVGCTLHSTAPYRCAVVVGMIKQRKRD